MNNTPLKVLQANVARSKGAHHELIRHFLNNDYSVALVCEPYIGRGPEVNNIVGIDIFSVHNTRATSQGLPSNQAIGLGRPRGDPILHT